MPIIGSSKLEITGDITASGAIVAEEFKTDFVSGSILYNSGSSKFGDTRDDNHEFTGSISLSGSNVSFLGGSQVGIGTASPDNELHLTDGSAGSVSANSNTQFTIESSGHAGIQFLSPSSNNNIIYFGDVNDNDVGYIAYQHGSNVLNFVVNTAEALAFDSSQNATFTANVISTKANGLISGSSTSTGSFGHLMVGGGNFTSASLAAGGGGGGSSFAGAAGTEALFSGSLVSSASFGKGGVKIIDSDLETQVVTRDWDLSTVSLDKFMQDGAVSDEWNGAWGITCSPDGRNVYVSVIGSSGDLPDSIAQYSLSSSFDIGSRTLHGSKDVSAQGSLHRAMVFSPDGTKLITIDTDNSKYNEYNLTKPWDITTLTYVQNATLQGSSQQGITARPDGLRLYQIGENDVVLELTLTSPWDVSTISGFGTSTSVSADGGTEHSDIWFRRDGRFAYLFDKNDKYLHKWELSTPWKFSTAAYTGENVAMPNNIKVWGNAEGTRLFGLDYGNERIYQYSWNGGPSAHQTSSIDIIGKTGIGGDAIIYQNLDVHGKVTGYDAEFKGDISGSATSTGSFAHLKVGGGNFTSASLAGGGGGASNAFKTISVSGQSDVVADSATDTLTLVAGSNMTLTTSAGGDSITFASSGGGGGSGTNSGSYTFTQAGDSTSWAITHSLGTKHNAVTVYDDSHQVVIPTSITADDANKTTIGFSSATSGYAVINSGGTTGTVTQISTDGSHVHHQSGDSTNWVITHSLNSKYPNVTVYDDSDEVIIPTSIKADTLDTATVTFSAATAGRAIFSMGGNLSGSLTSTGSFGRVDVQDGFYDGGTKLSVPDYVFEPEYELKSISELDVHISQSKHLPNVPDMNAIEEWKQLSMGDRDMLLLEKIEEMSLYIIQLHKRLEKLEEKS